jgi:hypothetical protein
MNLVKTFKTFFTFIFGLLLYVHIKIIVKTFYAVSKGRFERTF